MPSGSWRAGAGRGSSTRTPRASHIRGRIKTHRNGHGAFKSPFNSSQCLKSTSLAVLLLHTSLRPTKTPLSYNPNNLSQLQPCPSLLANLTRQVLLLGFVGAASHVLYVPDLRNLFQLINYVLGRKYLLHHTHPTVLLLLASERYALLAQIVDICVGSHAYCMSSHIQQIPYHEPLAQRCMYRYHTDA